MRVDDFRLIYQEMIKLYKSDNELTDIQVTFHFKKVEKERKTAKIDVKMFKN